MNVRQDKQNDVNRKLTAHSSRMISDFFIGLVGVLLLKKIISPVKTAGINTVTYRHVPNTYTFR